MKKKNFVNLLLSIFLISLIIFGYYFLIYEKKDFEGNTLTIYGWEDYLSEEIIESFENEYNVEVKIIEYLDEYEAMNDLIEKKIDADLFVVSDYLIPELKEKKILHKINLNQIPNYKNIDPLFLNREFDKNNRYSIPYMWGTTGILYNKKYFNPYEISINYLWDKNYLGKIGIVSDFQEIYFTNSRYLKISLPLENKNYFDLIEDEIIYQKEIVEKYYDYNEIYDKMINEELLISLVYSDSAFFAVEENPDLIYKIPKEGGTIWLDNLVILKESNNKNLAEKFINYLNEPEVNKKLTEELYTYTPNKAGYELLSENYFQKSFGERDLDKLSSMYDLRDNEEINSLKEKLWDEIKDN